jgi:hypothetical protein
MKTELKRRDGAVFITLEHRTKEGWIYVNWMGLQSVETVREGGEAMLDMLRQTGCHKILNDNRELVGPWDNANDWVEQTWTPKMIASGLKYLALVVSFGRYGQLSARDAHQRIGDSFEMRLFDDHAKARDWLRQAE